jgi:hypothetical protein
MASAISLVVTAQTIEDQNVKLSLSVLYFDQGLGVAQEQPVYVFFSPTASVGTIENAVEAAIIDQAKSYWPTMVLVPSDIIMIDIKKGT